MLIIGETQTRHSGSGTALAGCDNLISWIADGAMRRIIAVGGPTQWAAAGPLPANAVTTDLVQASSSDPALAAQLWEAFLRYVALRAEPGLWRRIKHQLFGLRVRVVIDDGDQRAAVLAMLSRCRGLRVVSGVEQATCE